MHLHSKNLEERETITIFIIQIVEEMILQNRRTYQCYWIQVAKLGLEGSWFHKGKNSRMDTRRFKQEVY
jgi:hypothetical protein